MEAYKICKRCIMDTTDPNIIFDEEGHCNHCNDYFNYYDKLWLRGDKGEAKLKLLLEDIKKEGVGKDYDCIIGLSGGVDSAYLAYLCYKWGLRTLAVHVDAGWNTEIAVKNIENICSKLNIDLITEVIDWNDMREVQKSLFKSQVVNQDIAQDHAFFAALYKFATKNRIKYVLNGYNIATESILPAAWRGQNAMDTTHIKSILKKYASRDVVNFPFVSIWKLRFFYRIFYRLKLASPLNFINYNKYDALEELKREVDFVDYGGKHNESRFTKFFQSYFLPKRFGYVKKRAHLSGMIVTNQISREGALIEINKSLYSSDVEINNDIEYFIKKIGITRDDFDSIMTKKPDGHESFPNEDKLNQRFDKVSAFIRKLMPF
jgi:N-acetyl sugar amidotransferase